MPHANLDAHFVRNAICPEGKSKVDYYDTAITGFILEVRASGGKTFHLRYRDPHGKQRQHKIGDTKSLSFDKARQAAQVLRSRVVLGESPAEERKVKRAIPTVAEFAEERYMPFVKVIRRAGTLTIATCVTMYCLGSAVTIWIRSVSRKWWSSTMPCGPKGMR